MMTFSPIGLSLVKSFEGLRLNPYQDSVGYWTIGYGHLMRPSDGFGVPIIAQFAEELLIKDLGIAIRAIVRLIKVPLKQCQVDALCSFVFNLGSGSLQASTLRQRLNRGDYVSAANEFIKWVNAGGKLNKGLIRRRIAERSLFLGKIPYKF